MAEVKSRTKKKAAVLHGQRFNFNLRTAYCEPLHSYLMNLCNASRISNLVFKVNDNY